MKKYISCLVIMFLCIGILQGQEKVIILKKGESPALKKGDYYRYAEQMEKEKPFEGVWEYRNGNENLTIKIEQKKTFTPKLDVYFDNPQLEYYYDKGNGEIISNSSLDGYRKSGRTISQNVIKFSTSDVLKAKTIYIEFELLGDSQARMTLKNLPRDIWDSVNITGEPKQKKDLTFSMPTNIVLTKK